jgi:hypothetical protein
LKYRDNLVGSFYTPILSASTTFSCKQCSTVERFSRKKSLRKTISYLICLTIGPTLLSAALYLCLARIIVSYGIEHSRFQPRTYTITFMSCDFTSLVLQSIGGGITSTSGDKVTSDAGVHIMVAGLALQVFSLVLFMVLCLEFSWHVRHSHTENFRECFADLRSTGAFRAFKYGS